MPDRHEGDTKFHRCPDTGELESAIGRVGLTDLRLALARNGYRPVPVAAPWLKSCKSPGKQPLMPKWQQVCAGADEKEIRRWADSEVNCTNTGLLCGDLIGVDVDVLNPALAEKIRAMGVAILGATPLVRIGRAPKVLFCYRAADPFRKMETPELFFPNGTKAQVEILAAGQQFVSHGVHPDTMKPYNWPNSAPETVRLDELPAVASDHLRAFLEAVEKIIRAAGGRTQVEIDGKASKAPPSGAKRIDFGKASDSDDFFKRVNRAALDAIETWFRAIFPSAKPQSGTGAWRVSSADLGRPLEEDISVHPVEGGRDFGTGKSVSPIDVVMEHGGASNAKQAALWLCERIGADPTALGWKEKKDGGAAGRGGSDRPTDPAPSVDRGQSTRQLDAGGTGGVEANEDAIALEFAGRYADTLRYCHDWGMWLHWDGTRWAREKRKLAFHFAREVAREANWEGKIGPAKASTAAGVERFAQADPRLATISDEWDVDSWKLGTPGGTVDLRTGALLEARRSDHITKQTAVAPADSVHGEGCPIWLEFLDQATQGDRELIRFLQQIAGYCLTGDVSEECLFFVYGPGGNGKGVFLNTIGNILGDYASSAAMDTFTASHGDKHPTDLAKLRSARMVTASETEEGRAWAEARIKELTGNERPISARFMRQDFFEYMPTFKLVFVGNHKPVLRNVDAAARRRFNIVPFVHKPEKPDPGMKEKLRAEYPAILRWMVDGCLDWQKHHLIRPAVVVEATEAYFREQDKLGNWLEECCRVDKDNRHVFESSAKLYGSWKDFCLRNGEESGTSTSFGETLTKAGFGKERKKLLGKATVVRTGISVIEPIGYESRMS